MLEQNNGLTVFLWAWFSLTFLSLAFVAWDLFTRTPAMKVMKWGWLLVTLYTGPVAFFIYWFSCREPRPGTHEKFVAPLWKQAVGSTIHCLAGDATGIIAAALLTSSMGFSMALDTGVEYAAGFFFGLLIFQALFMKDMMGGSYQQAVKSTWYAEWLSMNAVMAGMIPVMVIGMSRDMRAMAPSSPRFWGVMSLATLVGAVLAYPVNWWLVKQGLKHGMGTERALGRGGEPVASERDRHGPHSDHGPSSHQQSATQSKAMKTQDRPSRHSPQAAGHSQESVPVSTARKIGVALLTLGLLAAGVMVANQWGDFSMRRETRQTAKAAQAVQRIGNGSSRFPTRIKPLI